MTPQELADLKKLLADRAQAKVAASQRLREAAAEMLRAAAASEAK